jgi:G3E family GTPase
MLFLVGFLGSGKTTLLQYLLEQYPSKKIGIVLNDFGNASIDEERFSLDSTRKQGIHNGSIFCSCRSDQLISTVVSMAENHFDMIIVEASGLANPGTMYPILNQIIEQSKIPLDYAGSIGVVDAFTFDIMKQSNIVKNQLLYSDLILLNKVDLVSEDIQENIIKSIREIQQNSPVVSTNYARFDLDILESITPKTVQNASYGLSLNAQSYSFDPSSYTWDQVWTLCHRLTNKIHRIKGFYKQDESSIYIDCVRGYCTKQVLSLSVPNGIEFLSDDPIDLKQLIEHTIDTL